MIALDGNSMLMTGTREKVESLRKSRLLPLFGITDSTMYQRGSRRSCHPNLASSPDLLNCPPGRPTWSVLMTSNGVRKDYLYEAIGSLAAQTYNNFELIFVCHHDQEAAYVQKLALELGVDALSTALIHPRTRADRFREAVKLATGHWCCILDTDDVLHPDALWTVARCLNMFPNLHWFSGSHFSFMDDSDIKCSHKAEPIAQMLNSLAHAFRQRHFWGFRNDKDRWPPNAFESPYPVEDYHLFAALALNGIPVLPIPHELYAYRRHADQWTRRCLMESSIMCEAIRKKVKYSIENSSPMWMYGDMATATRMTRCQVILEDKIKIGADE